MAGKYKKCQYDIGDILETTNDYCGLPEGSIVIVTYPYKDCKERIKVVDKHDTEWKVKTKYLKHSKSQNKVRRAQLTTSYHGFAKNSYVNVVTPNADDNGCVLAVDAMGTVDRVPLDNLKFIL